MSESIEMAVRSKYGAVAGSGLSSSDRDVRANIAFIIVLLKARKKIKEGE